MYTYWKETEFFKELSCIELHVWMQIIAKFPSWVFMSKLLCGVASKVWEKLVFCKGVD
jgi:hypothetical protein